MDATVRSLLVVALTACSIKSIDYTGKACPCPSGYQCDLATDTCTRDSVSIVDAPSGDSTTIDARVVEGTSCLANPRSTLVYSSVGFPDFPQTWFDAEGAWQKEMNELVQSNSAAPLAWVVRSIPPINYRLVATMHLLEGNAGSVGLGFRVGGGIPNMYSCRLEPAAGNVELFYTFGGADTLLERTTVDITDAFASFTLEVDVTGNTYTCCVRGLSNSTVTASHSMFNAGAVGVLTRETEGAFASFYAYQ
jgi:hypothetical protein